MQLASICKTLARAANIYLQQRSFLMCDGLLPSRLDSKLLLSWAPSFTSFQMVDSILDVPGVAAFVAAACNLNAVSLCSSDGTAIATFEKILSKATSVKVLCCDHFIPRLLPPSLQALHLWLDPTPGSDYHPVSLEQVIKALVLRLQIWAPACRNLRLHFGTSPAPGEPTQAAHIGAAAHISWAGTGRYQSCLAACPVQAVS